MHLASHHRPLTRARFLVLLVLAAAAFTLTNCRNVGDRLSGVDVRPFKRPGTCLDACYDTYRRQVKAESELHSSLVQNCNGDESCLDEEDARHEAALSNIQADRIACQNSCHQQGGGSAGH